MSTVKSGDTVKVHYTGRLEDGTVFDSSLNREPLQFTVDKGEVISGFEEAVKGMEVGEKKTVTIPADKGYGPHFDELVMKVERSRFPENIHPEIGQYLEIQEADGRTMLVSVVGMDDQTVTLDANHPLAGKTLIFDIEVLEIEENS